MSENKFHLRLFPNTRTSSHDRIDGVVADFAGDHPFKAVWMPDGNLRLRLTGLSVSDASVATYGVLEKVKSKSANGPDFRGRIDHPTDSSQYEIAAWLKPMRSGDQEYLSLAVTQRPKKSQAAPSPATPTPAASTNAHPGTDASQGSEAAGDDDYGYYYRNCPPPADGHEDQAVTPPPSVQPAPPAEPKHPPKVDESKLKLILSTLVGAIEKATCSEDWAKLSRIAARAKPYLA